MGGKGLGKEDAKYHYEVLRDKILGEGCGKNWSAKIQHRVV